MNAFSLQQIYNAIQKKKNPKRIVVGRLEKFELENLVLECAEEPAIADQHPHYIFQNALKANKFWVRRDKDGKDHFIDLVVEQIYSKVVIE